MQVAKNKCLHLCTAVLSCTAQIQVTGPDKKRRDKNAAEFGEALKVYLGKREDRLELDYSAFKESLRQVALVKS